MRLALILFLLAFTPLFALVLPRSETVAVVGPPWGDASGMIAIAARADGAILRPGGHSNILIVNSPHPDFVRRLYGAGAWLVLDPLAAGGCLSVSPQAKI